MTECQGAPIPERQRAPSAGTQSAPERELISSAGTQPIGVFDSGVGGLTVLRALEQRLPRENYIYFGDTARAPYGNRSPAEIRRFNLEIGQWLLDQHCKMLLVACNTSTVLGMDTIKANTAKPVFGMMEAILAETLSGGSEPGAGTGSYGGGIGGSSEPGAIWPVGFIATKGTVDSGAYQRAFAEKAPGKPFFAQACPDFVPLVEAGVMDGPAVDRAVQTYLAPLRERGIRTLILGCTHYPYLAPVISAFLGPGVRLADPAEAMARLVEAYLLAHGGANDGAGEGHGNRDFFCSGDPGQFRSVGAGLLGHPIDRVRRQVFDGD